MEKPEIIKDCEIVPDRVIVYDNKCIGAKKYERFMMISLVHSHGDNKSPQFEGKGFVDIMLTEEQAEELMNKISLMFSK